MNSTPAPNRISTVSAALTILGGLLVIGGWMAHIEPIVHIGQGTPAIMFNTAAGLVLAGLGLLLYQTSRKLTAALGVLLGLLGGCTLAEIVTGLDFGIDEVIAFAWQPMPTPHPGRMGLSAAFLFVLIGLGYLAVYFREKSSAQVALLLTLFPLATAAVGLAGYAAAGESTLFWVTGMAPQTSVLFVMLALGFFGYARQTIFLWNRKTAWACLCGVCILAPTLLLWRGLLHQVGVVRFQKAQAAADRLVNDTATFLGGLESALEKLMERSASGCGRSSACYGDVRNYFRDFPEVNTIGWADPLGSTGQVYFRSGANIFSKQGPALTGEIHRVLANRIAGENASWSSAGRDSAFTYSVRSFATGPLFWADCRFVEKLSQITQVLDLEYAVQISVEGGDVSLHPQTDFLPPDIPLPRVTSQVLLLGHVWRFTLTPNLVSTASARASDLLLIVGILATIAITFAVYFWQTSLERSQAISVLNRELNEKIVESKTAESRLRLMVEGTKDYAIFMLDANGCVATWNEGAERCKLYSAQEILGKHFSCFYSEEDIQRGHPADELRLAIANGQFREQGWRIRGDGSRFWADVAITALRDEAGTLCGFSKITRDITHLRKLERKLHRVNKRLSKETKRAQAANQAKSQFLARMSHEIRTPMNAILGMAYVLSETPLAEDQVEFVRIFRTSAERLLQIINDILDLSKVEAGHLRCEDKPFDLAVLLSEVTDLMSTMARQKGLSFACGIAPDIDTRVIGDAPRLRQILVNLVGNAFKFSESGSVLISVTKCQHPVDRLLQFDVQDTGSGIPAGRLDKIFDAFVQLDSSLSRQHSGTGLGLTISRRLAELMGGKIWATSKVGSGSTFSFTSRLPSQAKPEQCIAPGPIAATAPSGSVRLLVAEDSPENLLVLQLYLSGTGHIIDHVPDGQQAVNRFQNGDYDLVLMDVQMPLMDGYTATQLIRQWERAQRRQRTPIVALTAHALAEDAQRSLDAGCDGHVTKPFTRHDILETIALHVTQLRPCAEMAADRRLIAPQFLEAQHLHIVEIQKLMELGDFDAIRQVARRMSGSGSAYGLAGVSEIGRQLEFAGRSRDVANIRSQLASLTRYLSSVDVTSADVTHATQQ